MGATRRDLGLARQAVINAILAKGHIPSGMELWSAGTRPPPEVVAKYLARCDAHIILIGARYGSPVHTQDSVGFTEWEYRQSKNKRPILAFLFDHESLVRARKLEKDKGERNPEKQAKLDNLRKMVQRERYVKEFRNDKKGLGELQKEAILAIDELVATEKSLENGGWVRGDTDEAQTIRDIANNPFLKRELDQLRRFSTLGARVRVDVGSKTELSAAFWANMQGRLRRHGYRHLFFESGSTIAYLADEFGRAVLQPGEDSQRWHIRTNNVLSLVYFDLHTPIDAGRFPAGVPDPDDKYGAIFPNEWRHLHEPPPTYPRRFHAGKTEKEEAQAVDEMRRLFVDSGRRQIALAAASGLDLDHQVAGFRGPHVGSHPNMLFKRAIFTSGCPVVLFLGAEKLGNPFQQGKCYPVFGPEQSWANAIRRYPIAVCVGYEWPRKGSSSTIPGPEARHRNSATYVLETLAKIGFKRLYFHTESDHGRKGAIMCANEAFFRKVPND